MIDRIRPFAGFDYIQTENPTIDVNPKELGVTWLNMTTGEVFVCTDSAFGLNVWVGQLGTQINFALPYSLPSHIILRTFATPAGDMTGLTFDGTNLISCSNDTDTIYIHDGVTENILDSFSTPSTSCQGLDMDGSGNLISCDSSSDRIYIHEGVSSTITSDFAAPSAAVYGVAYTGDNLITGDLNANRFYISQGLSNVPVTDWHGPANDPRAVVWDGVNLISSTSDNLKINIHDGILESTILQLDYPGTQSSGLAIDGDGRLISVDYYNDTIYVHKRADEL